MSLESKIIKISKIIVADGETDFKIRQILYKIWRNMNTDNKYLDEDYNSHYQFHHLDDIDDKYIYRRRVNKRLNMLLMYCLLDAGDKIKEDNIGKVFNKKFIDKVYNSHKNELKKDLNDYYKNETNKSKTVYTIIREEAKKIKKDLLNVAVITEPIHRFITNKTNKKKYNIQEIKKIIDIFDNQEEIDDNDEDKINIKKFIKDRLDKINIEKINNIQDGCEKIKIMCELLEPEEKIM